ncbi:MutS_V domain-containing protein [Cephalotus follicularis]|uniref:MutS_V domain-containing protein n=1 Tax=Cephalotus follicularis TaxID=3775 RepID=A0A1Q3DAG4_CEPFO|nr:MutS_V domain-containing protein [Cephalotus follicularis]
MLGLQHYGCAVFGNSISISKPFAITRVINVKETRLRRVLQLKNMRQLCFASLSTTTTSDSKDPKSRVRYDSLRVLEWDKVCESVASFAGTGIGREATKAQLWSLTLDHTATFDHSLALLNETDAAVQMHQHGSFDLDLNRIDLHLLLVKSAIQRARRGLPLEGSEAMAVAVLLQFVESLQLKLKAAFKQDTDCFKRFMPLTELIMQLVVSRSLLNLIQKIIDEDGFVKDSASSALERSRDQMRVLERKLYQLMDGLIRNEMNEASLMEVTNIDGRWCIKSGLDQQTSFKGLLLSSGSGIGNIIEPFSAVPFNDELQQARALASKAEVEVLLMLTEKMRGNLDDIEKILNCVVQLDVINARAIYSLSFGGTRPYIFLPEDEDGSLTTEPYLSGNSTSRTSYHKTEWTLYLPKAYHPLLLEQHRQNLRKAQKDVSNATAEIRRRKLRGEKITPEEETDINLPFLEMQVTALEQGHPVPVDFIIAQKTRVLVITGPNTGGKTICLKTVALAAIMAKSGLYVLSSESVQIPWFDSVFADIGDEQSLSQSLSSFSGHLKQISDIKSQSTTHSFVLLDEVGAGTNPLEGAALGMALLESFAESGALLTIATTHHGELKTLKYSNATFENACMEFDEVNFRPTYKILWGIPGRSNAINIAELLGLPSTVVDNARELYGAAGADINKVIIEMERLKQIFQELLYGARHYLRLSKDLHENLLHTRSKIMVHGREQRYRKMRLISEAAEFSRSFLQNKVRQLRAYATQPSQPSRADKCQYILASNNQDAAAVDSKKLSSLEVIKQVPSVKRTKLPKTGDMVHVSSLGKKATVLRVELSKEEIVVQAGNMKLKLKLKDVEF